MYYSYTDFNKIWYRQIFKDIYNLGMFPARQGLYTSVCLLSLTVPACARKCYAVDRWSPNNFQNWLHGDVEAPSSDGYFLLLKLIFQE